MKTYSLKKEEVDRNWFVVDATDKILGRVATKIADRIRGKDKPTFTPHLDTAATAWAGCLWGTEKYFATDFVKKFP